MAYSMRVDRVDLLFNKPKPHPFKNSFGDVDWFHAERAEREGFRAVFERAGDVVRHMALLEFG